MSATSRLGSAALQLYTNMRGWRTRRKLLVIQSDDWGAIRMPGPVAYEQLLKAGIRVDLSRYDSLDCLESRDDFQALMNVIDDHRDFRGRPAIFTFNTVMGNPDFEAIETDEFSRFHHQHLFEGYRHYYGEDLEPNWHDAMDAGLIRPQFHAREHLNSPLWMTDLRAGHEETRLAFRHGFYGLKTRTSSPVQKNYLTAHWPETPEQFNEVRAILANGLAQFKETFGFPSRTFVACNYVWPEELEQSLSRHGVRMLQTQRGRIEPVTTVPGKTRIRRHYTGQENRYGQRYSVRNVLFEPYMDENVDWSDRALRQVKAAFRLGTPAIVSTHRVNYVSRMDQEHRNRNLKQLDQLLSRVCHFWPDVEFITSEELSDLIHAECR